jgi:hypothetical protein
MCPRSRRQRRREGAPATRDPALVAWSRSLTADVPARQRPVDGWLKGAGRHHGGQVDQGPGGGGAPQALANLARDGVARPVHTSSGQAPAPVVKDRDMHHSGRPVNQSGQPGGRLFAMPRHLPVSMVFYVKRGARCGQPLAVWCPVVALRQEVTNRQMDTNERGPGAAVPVAVHRPRRPGPKRRPLTCGAGQRPGRPGPATGWH